MLATTQILNEVASRNPGRTRNDASLMTSDERRGCRRAGRKGLPGLTVKRSVSDSPEKWPYLPPEPLREGV